MKYEDIMVCQFSVNKDKEIHFHNNVEIFYVLEGIVKLEVDGEVSIITEENFVVINSNVRHGYTAKDDVLVASIIIDNTRLVQMFGGKQMFFLCNSTQENSEGYDKIRRCIHSIFDYYHNDKGQGVILRNSIEYQLLYVLTTDFEIKRGMSKYDSLRGIKDERQNDILSYMMSNYKEQITLQGLADRLYLSNAYLSKYIKKSFGMSFLKLLNNIRMDYAVSELIYTDKSIIRVAMDNGFPNMAGFNRVFREMYDTTPAEYREEAASKHLLKNNENQNEEKEIIMKKIDKYISGNHSSTGTLIDTSAHIVEADAKKQTCLNQNWNKVINIGTASDLLKYDFREHIKFLKDNLKFEYIRFWNLLSDDVLITLDDRRARYNFSAIDKIFDFIKEIGCKPFIEIGFKPMEIYENVNKILFERDTTSHISVVHKNRAFLVELVKHLVKRYGVREVENWYIELEKNAVYSSHVTADAYADAYTIIYDIFKNYVPNIHIGGAGMSLNVIGTEFANILMVWKKRNLKMDFFSIYSYPYLWNPELVSAGRNPYSSDENYLYNQISEVKQIMNEIGFKYQHFMVTEWSSTLSNRNVLNDSCFKASYIMKNLIQCSDKADMIGYWVASDLYSDYYDTGDILFGGCGLISQNCIKKPSYYAYAFLNSLGKVLLSKTDNAIVTSNDDNIYIINCHNYKHLNFRYFVTKENEIEVEGMSRLFEDNERLQLSFRIKNVPAGTYIVKMYLLSFENGDIQAEWRKIGYYGELNKQELDYLKEVSQPKIKIQKINVEKKGIELDVILDPQEIRSIVIMQE